MKRGVTIVATAIGLFGRHHVSDDAAARIDRLRRRAIVVAGNDDWIAVGIDAAHDADMAAAAKDPALARVVSDKVAAIVLRAEENADAFGEVVYFFNRLGLCVEAALCSRKTAEIFFEDSLDSFLEVFGGRIDRLRETRPRYGEAMLNLHAAVKKD
mgnify:CR=1 FL=1